MFVENITALGISKTLHCNTDSTSPDLILGVESTLKIVQSGGDLGDVGDLGD